MCNIVLETPRLLLRNWQESDLEFFTKMNANPEVMRYFPDPYSRERTKRLFEAIQLEFADFNYGLYATEEKATGLFMGYIGFHRARFAADFCPCVEIGWRLGSAFWNKGFATEGASACLEHGFNNLKFNKVYSFTATKNLPSERVMQKIGMTMDRYFDHPGVPENHPLRPHVLYAATHE